MRWWSRVKNIGLCNTPTFSDQLIRSCEKLIILLIQDWYFRGYLVGSSAYDGELILAMIILIGNVLFDIPFIRSIISHKRKI